MRKQTVRHFIKFSKTDTKKLYKNQNEFRTFYRKGIGVLSKITSGNIKKKVSKIKESVEGNG